MIDSKLMEYKAGWCSDEVRRAHGVELWKHI